MLKIGLYSHFKIHEDDYEGEVILSFPFIAVPDDFHLADSLLYQQRNKIYLLFWKVWFDTTL